MAAIRIRRKLDSETLHLPELRPLIGRDVEIVVQEEKGSSAAAPLQGSVRGTGDWDTVLAATWRLNDYDYQAQIDQDVCDSRDAEERLR